MKTPQYISHLKHSNEWIFQSNEEHEYGVAQMAERFASKIGGNNIGKILGLLHDIGKEQLGFQNYIRKISGYDESIKLAPKTPHAFVGAIVAQKMFPQYFPLFSYPIASHHSGLKDLSDFFAMMANKLIPEDVDWHSKEKLHVTLPAVMNKVVDKDLNHLIRFFFSCLVDADYLDTEAFMEPERNRLRSSKNRLSELLPLLEKHLEQLSNNAPATKLNKLRCSIQNICKNEAEEPAGFFSLTVPTGGGKTLSSLLWAMHHAIKNHKERIIIAIPYTSIIVQTAATLRRIFGDENVCEHHSSFDPDQLKSKENVSDSQLIRQRLATENWDYPIVVTTNVQLFESMFSNKPSACRKLHNIANSVLILDEVQMLPLDYLQPIVDGLDTYQRILGISVLFTTASQPVLEGDHRGTISIFHGLPKIKEIIPQPWKLHEQLRRVNLIFDKNRSDYNEIAKRLIEHDRVLCIVNTRRDAAEIFNRLPDKGRVFHLSRRMCPKHIQTTLETIRTLLKDPNEKIIRVVSTQLIEAGVDLDFPVIFRQESGLDSILQAAGRCNREGRLDISNTYVFKLDKALPNGFMSWANSARLDMREDSDWFSPDAISDYFVRLYSKYESFDKKQIECLLGKNELKFETAAKAFRLIENEGINIVVNYENSCELINKIKYEGFSYDFSKKISKFMVNINQQDFKTLNQGGFIEEIIEGIYFLPDREQYRQDIGLTTENHWLDDILIQ